MLIVYIQHQDHLNDVIYFRVSRIYKVWNYTRNTGQALKAPSKTLVNPRPAGLWHITELDL